MASHNILFLGATNGSGFEALLNLLQDPMKDKYNMTIVARKPLDFLAALETRSGTGASALQPVDHDPVSKWSTKGMTVVQGDGLDGASLDRAVEAALAHGPLTTVVITLGPEVHLNKWRPWAHPTMTIPGLCGQASKNVLGAIEKAGQTPYVVGISSAYLLDGWDRTPYVLRPLCSWMLHEPHKDKERMEQEIRASGLEWTLVRPAFMMNGSPTEQYRTSEILPRAYTIRRSDIGHFMYQEILGGPQDKGQWKNKVVEIAY